MIQIGSKTISNIQFGSKTSTELYLGSTKIWPEGGSTETWPEGTFLYTKDNQYITADQYSSGYTKNDIIGVYHYDITMYDDSSGLLTNPSPILIAIDVPDILSSKGVSEVNVCRSGATDLIGIGTCEITDSGYSGLQSDWNGYENTKVLNNLLATNNNIVEDAAYVAATCFAVDGRQGYLPSSAELYRAVLHKAEIQELIALVGGTVVIAGSTYVSSTKITQDGSGTNKFYCKQDSADNFLENTDTTEVLVFFKPGVYTCDYYGVKFEGDSTDGTRIGNLDLAKLLPLQSKMKGCTLTSDGTVKYLDPNDWTKYEDGTSRNYSLNTMVELPEYWCYGANLTFGTGGNHIILVTENSTYGWYHFPKRYVSAYEASSTVESNVDILKSVAGYGVGQVYPQTGKSMSVFEEYANANGNGYHMYTYDIHKQICWLFITEYATRNSQETFVQGVDQSGYKIGGLGTGMTDLGSSSSVYSYCGIGDSLGNNTGEISDHGLSVTTSIARYRGIENPFGSTWKAVIDAIVDKGVIKTNDDPTSFSSAVYTAIGTAVSGNAYVISLLNSTGVSLEIFEDSRSISETGSSTTYWSDYQRESKNLSDRLVCLGGFIGSNDEGGLFCINAATYGTTQTNTRIGTRLTYYPAA